MRCFVYCFYNKKVGAYEKPIVNNFEIEVFKELVLRDVMVSDNQAKDRMKECELYYLGIYDDVTGEFETFKPKFVVDLGYLIEGKKEGDNHGDSN